METNYNENIGLLATPENKFGMAKTVPYSINISFHDKDHNVIGNFKEVDGLLTFEGKVDESAQIFVDFICKTFKERIEYLYERTIN